ncbi:hypothetical protein C4E15_01130 [Achromobacter spanius]|uniref:SMI1/KNR4 family protein n=1 Tax=Achromobacter spanius TaxID=217203 RepID=A0A2S5GY58_9BURK|nr:SMI1/KNR4 family protein [Achromobacter spanius]PPA77926.1 hypothetical protein C4E15_01130 [Achromobacter spanius]
MSRIDDLRDRYVALNGLRPAAKEFLNSMENGLGVTLPAAFREVCDFFDGTGINAISLFSLTERAATLNPLAETIRLRARSGIPHDYLAIGEPAESLLVMKCAGDGGVLWVDALDVGRIETENFLAPVDSWACFLDFFEFLLDEEEADRS